MKLSIFSILLILVIAGCTNNNISGGVTAVDKINNCDDTNECTKDTFDNGKCLYESITPCCGNNICEAGEGCNVVTKTTFCSKDCNVCDSEVEVKLRSCEGNCLTAADGSLRIKGDSTLNFDVKNLGEEEVKLNSGFSCSKQGQGTGTIKLEYYGFSNEGYFENSQSSITLGGKARTKYTVALTGKPKSSVNLECNMNMLAGNKIFLESFFMRLE